MITFLQRFRQMVKGLENHPKISVLNYSEFTPATLSIFKTIEATLGHTLNPSITNFYSQTNGLQLRWQFSNNEANTTKIVEKTLDWKYALKNPITTDGMIMILPIEQVFLTDWTTDFFFIEEEMVSFKNQVYQANNFYRSIKPFDLFDKNNSSAFFLENGKMNVLISDNHHTCYDNSRLTTFASYLEFLLANKGVVAQRSSFYSSPKGNQQPLLKTPQHFWTLNNSVDLDLLSLKEKFLDSEKKGANTTGLKTLQMQQMAEKSVPITQEILENMITNHHAFLSSGGAGGHWKTLSISGFVIGTYMGGASSEGEQASFDGKHLPRDLDLQECLLPFANFCGMYARYQDFSEADLSYSLVTDAMLEHTIFADANLQGADFSRANLKGASFMNANLKKVDFENADLTGADFRGANLEGARFPGAILKNVKI